MENIKKLNSLIQKATSNSHNEIPPNLKQEILDLIRSRVDMPKHAIAAISKRLALKNKTVLINIFTLLEFLAYECELPLYSQISTKEFLFKISGLMTNKDIDPAVKGKILQTLYCCEELFRPHEDLLPLFFQFYAGVLRNGFQVPYEYRSPFRPAKLKTYNKYQEEQEYKREKKRKQSNANENCASEKHTFQEIREKILLTNEIITNADPLENIKQNALLLEMMEQIKQCQKTVQKTINENPNQEVMEMALAVNDDIYLTYKRFKDLQKRRKPDLFVLTELTSDAMKEKEGKVLQSKNQILNVQEQPRSEGKEKNNLSLDILGIEEPSKKEQQQQKKEENLFDLDFVEPIQKQQEQNNNGGDIFDLLGGSQPTTQTQQPQPSEVVLNLLGDFQVQNMPKGPIQNSDYFQTDLDMKVQKQNEPAMQKLDALTFDWLNKN